MESIPPEWNDPNISDEDWIYRRVLNRPDFFTQSDVLTGEPRIGRNAFKFDSDGMSVYRHGLIVEHRLTLAQIRRNSGYFLYKVAVGTVRKLSAGVVDDPDTDDPVIGIAHASVRCELVIKPPPAQRRVIQEGLIAAAQLVLVNEPV
jgi:hypothetical protein